MSTLLSPRSSEQHIISLEYIQKAAELETKQRSNADLIAHVSHLETYAAEQGLTPDVITLLLDIACTTKFTVAVNSRLIKCLIPRTVVPEDAVIKAVSCMCANQLSLNIQMLLLRWIIVVFPYLDKKEKIHSLYGIIFLFLDSQKLMPSACHLLYLITRREHVRMFRVRHLLNIQAVVGVQPCLTGLLNQYKLYYPNLVSVAISRSRKVFFRTGDNAWRDVIRRIQEQNRPPSDPPSLSMLGLQEITPNSKQHAKRRRIEVPALVTARGESNGAQRSNVKLYSAIDEPVPISHIHSFNNLLEHIDHIEMPSQIASVFNSPFLQHTMSCYQEMATTFRLSMWLHHTLNEYVFHNLTETAYQSLEQLLWLLVKYSRFLQESVPVCELFLHQFLPLWNGHSFRVLIFELLVSHKIWPFRDFKLCVLEPLHSLFFTSSIYFKCQVITLLSELVQHWCTVELARQDLMNTGDADKALDNMTTFATTTGGYAYQFGCDSSMVCERSVAIATIQSLISYIDTLCCVALIVEDNSSLLLHFILDFYEMVPGLHLEYKLPFVKLPSASLIYRSLLSADMLAINRISTLLCRYKDAFTSLKSMPTTSCDITATEIEQIPMFNVYIQDSCDALWRFKAFQSSRTRTLSSSCFTISPSVLESLHIVDLGDSLSMYKHQAIMAFILKYTAKTGRSTIVPQSLKHERDQLLAYLDECHLTGLSQFVTIFLQRAVPAATSSPGTT